MSYLIFMINLTLDLEDFNTACKLPQWGSASEPHKSAFKEFLASITMEESGEITQATIGSIHFPAIHYFALFVGRCIKVKMRHVICVFLILVFSRVLY